MAIPNHNDMLENASMGTPIFTFCGLETYARLLDVYDGDSIIVAFVVHDTLWRFQIRLNGIDAHELKSNDRETKTLATITRNRLIQHLSGANLHASVSRKEIQEYFQKNKTIVQIKCYQFDKYGRLLADVYNTSNSNVAELLLSENLVVLYNGGKKILHK
jgi:endonuclease YncB( thermonuclease family)